MSSESIEASGFLIGDGEMAARMRNHDWSANPLGPPRQWPQSLKSAVSICLHSSFPTAIYWGEDLRLLYNDAWAPIPADRHPWALGRPAAEVWADIWEVVGPQLRMVWETGEGFSTFDQLLPMVRNGRREETYWNYSFTPIRGENGQVSGVLNQGHEVTDRIFGERRQRLALDLSDALRELSDPAPIISTAQRMLGEALGADRVGYGEVEAGERYFTTLDNWTSGAIPPRHGTHDLAGFGPEIWTALRAGVPLVIDDVTRDPRTSSPAYVAAFDAIDTRAALTSSLIKGGRVVAALYVHCRDPRGWTATHLGMVEDVAERTWAAIDRVKALAEAGASENRLRRVLNGMDEGFALLGDDFTILGLNAEALRLDRRPVDRLIGQSWWQAYPETEDQEVGRLFRRAMEEQSPVSVEHCMTFADGRTAWLDLRAFPSEGGLALFYRDITDRRNAQERLSRSEAELRAVYDAVPVGLIVAEAPSGRIVGGNAEVERVFGHPVIPSPDVDHYRDWIAHHADGSPVLGPEFPLSKALRGEKERPELEVLYRRGDGRDAWLRLVAAPIRAADGAIRGAVVAALDIDRRRRTEAELQALNERLEAEVLARTAERDQMWRLSTDLMLVARFDGTIHAVNPAWQSLLGWEEVRLRGLNFLELVHSGDRAETVAELKRLESGATTFRFTNRYRGADGDYRFISWTAVPGGDFVHAVGRDITAERQAALELERAQEALRQSQKLEAMGQLTGGVAHDFNNLLSPIVGGLDLLQKRGVGDERARRTITGALASAERARLLVQRLLAFARRQPLQPTAVDVSRIVEGMADLLASTLGPRIRLQLDLAADLPPAKADANQLEMALLNLAVNARDAMGGGGQLDIMVDQQQIRADTDELKAGAYVRIRVSDTGRGMDQATISRCIEPFFSTKGVGQGTGLGLSMVHGLTAQLGGALQISSRVGEGTQVLLWLPATEAIAADPTTGEERRAIGAVGTALVVDDEELVRASTTAMLEDLGYRIIEAQSGEEALRRLEGEKVDILVTDHLMPRMTGTELASVVRRVRPDVKLLIVSGYAEVEGIAPDLPRLTKPFRQADLVEALEALSAA